MQIVEGNFKFKAELKDRDKTTHLVLHHAMWKNCTAQDIHRIHINERKFFGIGYNYFVSKDGFVTTGRSIEKIGAHCEGCNDYSIGICFEGDYETEENMPQEQLQAGRELIKMISDIYPDIIIKEHKDMPNQATLCGGKYFPFDDLINLENNFTDTKGHWCEKMISQAYSNGLIKGYSDNTFKPDKSITRAEMVVIIMNLYDRISKK